MIRLITAPIRSIVRFPLFQLAIVIGIILWLQTMISRRMISNPSSSRTKHHPRSQEAAGNHQDIGPRLDFGPRQPWWMDIPNWLLTGFEPVGHATW